VTQPDPRKLRKGWTTGTCATAAAKAACLLLRDGEAPQSVDVPMVRGDQRARLAVRRCALEADGRALAVVVKDAGDDPDVTHGAHLTARVRVTAPPAAGAAPGVVLLGGEGVGTVTKPGLGLEVGGPAINKGPRSQITAGVAEVFDVGAAAVEVEVSVPGGDALAQQTSNPRLGILGGISILGTSGVVRPFSTAAWRASVGQAIDVMDAQGARTLVLATGGRSERAARRMEPALPDVCFVEVGDFVGYAIKRAISHAFERCLFVGMLGKLSKLAAGVMMTHSAGSKIDPAFLAQLTADAGGDEALVAAVTTANTARHASELWAAAGLTGVEDLVCRRAADELRAYGRGRLPVDVVMVDFDGARTVGVSPGARVTNAVELRR
jgi:cobalt-precorrin-5B (C1)-methyltransferase